MCRISKYIYDPRLHLLLIVLVTAFSYSNIFQNEFVWDDPHFIVSWEEIQDLRNIPNLLMGDLPPEHRDVYRPIRSVSYALSYQLFGTDPFGYHLLSISVHLLCTILIYLIVLRITKKNMVALITSLLFGAHPVHTEAITFITTSFDIIGMTFFFAAFHFYLLSQQKGNPDHIAHYRVAYFISILCAAIAFFTYELTLTLPFLLVLHQSCFGRQTGLNLWSKVKVHLPYFLAAIIYLTIRFVVVEVGSRGGYFAGSFYHTSLTMLKAFTKYLLILLFPINIGIEHVLPTNILTLSAYAVNKPAAFLSQSIFDPAVVLSILLFFGIFLLRLVLNYISPIFQPRLPARSNTS